MIDVLVMWIRHGRIQLIIRQVELLFKLNFKTPENKITTCILAHKYLILIHITNKNNLIVI